MIVELVVTIVEQSATLLEMEQKCLAKLRLFLSDEGLVLQYFPMFVYLR